MRSYWSIAAALVLGCGSAKPSQPTVHAQVVTTKGDAKTLDLDVLDKPRFQIVMNEEMSCLRVDDTLRCWKRTQKIQEPITQHVPPVAGLDPISDVAMGARHVCVLTTKKNVHCWGDNTYGQLGARRSEEHIDTPVRVEGIEGAIALGVGTRHSCAVLGDGRVSCWGWNAGGQTGGEVEYSPDTRELVEPGIVPGISGVGSIVAGYEQTCATTKAGLWCWGISALKSEFDAHKYNHHEPARIGELDEIAQLAINDRTSCGVFKDGHVTCWGSAAFGILPTSTNESHLQMPIALPSAWRVVPMNTHGCAILRDGRVSCWGRNDHGELGRSSPRDAKLHEPAVVSGLPTPVQSLFLGPGTSCAVLPVEQLWCWGVPPHESLGPDAGSGLPSRVQVEP